MMCPLCAQSLKTVERQGVELDWCSQCGGLWLDQGELNELVRREAAAALARGEQALRRERHDREFDATLEDPFGAALPEVREVVGLPFALSRGDAPIGSVRR